MGRGMWHRTGYMPRPDLVIQLGRWLYVTLMVLSSMYLSKWWCDVKAASGPFNGQQSAQPVVAPELVLIAVAATPERVMPGVALDEGGIASVIQKLAQLPVLELGVDQLSHDSQPDVIPFGAQGDPLSPALGLGRSWGFQNPFALAAFNGLVALEVVLHRWSCDSPPQESLGVLVEVGQEAM